MFDDGYKYENVDIYLQILIIKDDVHIYLHLFSKWCKLLHNDLI